MGQDGLSLELPALLPRLWRFALRLAGDRHDAEDLVQRACVRALERQQQLQPGTATLSWLFSIVHSVWLNEVRARQIRSHGSIQWSEELAETVADPAARNPESCALSQEIIAAVEKTARRTARRNVAGSCRRPELSRGGRRARGTHWHRHESPGARTFDDRESVRVPSDQTGTHGF